MAQHATLNQTIRVLVADDHPLFRDGVCHTLANAPGIDVVGVAGSGSDAVRLAAELRPDLLLLDVSMPDIGGPEVVQECRKVGVDAPVIFLTMHKYRELLRESIDLGVRGYVLKDSPADEVIDAINSVVGGENYLSPAVANLLMTDVLEERAPGSASMKIRALTPAQRKVLRLIATDRTSKEIAGELHLSVRTIENHRARMCKKLGLAGAHSLVKFAFDHRGEL